MDRRDSNRSALIERATQDYLRRIEKDERDRRDIEIINANLEQLTREVLDNLEMQGDPYNLVTDETR